MLAVGKRCLLIGVCSVQYCFQTVKDISSCCVHILFIFIVKEAGLPLVSPQLGNYELAAFASQAFVIYFLRKKVGSPENLLAFADRVSWQRLWFARLVALRHVYKPCRFQYVGVQRETHAEQGLHAPPMLPHPWDAR